MVATLVVGYIFSGIVKLPRKDDVIESYTKRFDLEEFKFAVLVAAPGVILHELGHKLVAMSFGLQAFFEIWPTGLIIGVVLKFLGSPFILIAPGYVTVPANTTLQLVLTASAGPLVNLLLWIGSLLILKYKKNLSRNNALILLLTQNINKWLFIFNMIPIPPLDGSKVLWPVVSSLF